MSEDGEVTGAVVHDLYSQTSGVGVVTSKKVGVAYDVENGVYGEVTTAVGFGAIVEFEVPLDL